MRVLFLTSNPSDTTRLAVTEEYREVDARIRASDGREEFALEFAPEVRADRLGEVLQRHRPDIVHVSGHGSGDGELLLSDASGRAVSADPERVAAVFGALPPERAVRCVVLNACYSDALAAALVRHVDCVIGVPSALRDKAAIAFAGSFYGSLGYGATVEGAYKLACAESALIPAGATQERRLHWREGVDASAYRVTPRVAKRAPFVAAAEAERVTIAAPLEVRSSGARWGFVSLAALGLGVAVWHFGAHDEALPPHPAVVDGGARGRDAQVRAPLLHAAEASVDAPPVAPAVAPDLAPSCAERIVCAQPRAPDVSHSQRCVVRSVRSDDDAVMVTGCARDELDALCRSSLDASRVPRACADQGASFARVFTRGLTLRWRVGNVSGGAPVGCVCGCDGCAPVVRAVQRTPPRVVEATQVAAAPIATPVQPPPVQPQPVQPSTPALPTPAPPIIIVQQPGQGGTAVIVTGHHNEVNANSGGR